MSRVGRDVSVAELLELYDAVILATGAPHDRKLGIPGEDLPGVVGSAEFVGWYNGHPEFADLEPASGRHPRGGHRQRQCRARLRADPGQDPAEFDGSDIVNHALDALERSAIRTITILGRRGPHQIAMTPKELGELGHLEAALPDRRPQRISRRDDADEALEPGQRKSVTILREFEDIRANKPKRWCSISSPSRLRIEGEGRAERIIVERTELDDKGGARGTGETYEVPASLIISCDRLFDLADRRRSL